jgi:hypothetical protein
VFRLVNAYRSDGAKGLISKRRDFGPTLAAEKLREVHEIVLGRETLRLWMIEAGIWADCKQRRKHRGPSSTSTAAFLIAWARQRSSDGAGGSEHLPPGRIKDAAACLTRVRSGHE